MPMPKLPKLMPFILSSFCLISCALKPPDVPVFEDLQQWVGTDPVTKHLILNASPMCMLKIQEVECGHGVFIVSGKEIYIGENAPNLYNGKKWSQLKSESIYCPAKECFAPIETYMVNTCAQNKCDNTIDAYKVKLDSLNGISGVLATPP